MTVLAVVGHRRNDRLIADCFTLPYMNRDGLVLDATFDQGTFWKRWRPPRLVRLDRFSTHPDLDVRSDFRRMPFPDLTFDTVVYDPPYALKGTVDERRWNNGRYGFKTGEYLSVAARHRMMCDGFVEGWRVLAVDGILLAKCEDSVCSGRMWWQTDMYRDLARTLGMVKVDRYDLLGARAQPARTRWACVACDRGFDPDEPSVGPGHQCRASKAMPPDLNGRFGPGGHDNPDRPWLRQIRSVQRHAHGRGSTLLVFRKTTHDVADPQGSAVIASESA